MKISLFVFFWYFVFFIIACFGWSGLVGLSLESKFVFSSILIFYILGVIFAKISPHKKNGVDVRLYVDSFSVNVKTERFINLFISVFFIYSLFVVVNLYVFNSFDLDEYRKAFFDGSRDNVKYFGGGWLFYLYYFFSLLLYALTPLVFLFSSKKTIAFLFLSFFVYDIIFLSRTGIYYFLLTYLCSNLVRGKSIFRAILWGCAILIIALIIGYFRDSIDNIIVSISSSILNYHIVPFLLFDKNIISSQIIHYSGLGLASLGMYNVVFYPLEPNIMVYINELREQLSIFYDLGDILYQPYNAYYTSLSLVYIDFGIIGCLLLSFLSGFLMFFLYEKSRFSKKYAVLCVFFAVLLLESLFSPVMINIFAFVIVVYFLLMFFINSRI